MDEEETEDTPRPILFLDRAIDGNRLAAALLEAGTSLKRHRDIFKDDEEDAAWLAVVGQNDWFVITKDARIRYNPLEIQALKAANVGVFVFIPKNVTGDEIAQMLVQALPAIEEATRLTARPFIIKVYRDGTLKAVEI